MTSGECGLCLKLLRRTKPLQSGHLRMSTFLPAAFAGFRQWGPIWQITAEPVDPPDFLRQLAVEQASILKPISPLQVARYFKSMPRRAHGGRTVWSIEMLKQLNLEECQTMVQLFHRIEQSGDIPNQWKVAMVVMLPKAWDVERPIALLHTVYKSLLKFRWALIEEWLPVVREKNAMGRGAAWERYG